MTTPVVADCLVYEPRWRAIYGVQVAGNAEDGHVIAGGHVDKMWFVAAANRHARTDWGTPHGLGLSLADVLGNVGYCWASEAVETVDLDVKGVPGIALPGNLIITFAHRDATFPITVWCPELRKRP